MKNQQSTICTIIPNLNGRPYIEESIQSLRTQSIKTDIVVVDNSSSDGSLELLESMPDIHLIKNAANLGFAGGVNPGIAYALKNKYNYIALFNNDAVAEKNWLKSMVSILESSPEIGISTCLFLNRDGSRIDSTGEMYSTWLLPFPRHRDKRPHDLDLSSGYIFAASGGASLYRSTVFRDIGLFDEDFFAYYEDVDLSFRAQRAGWKIWFESSSVAYHRIGSTSSKLKGFTVYQSFKNIPLIWIKNLSFRLILKYSFRFWLVYLILMANQCRSGNARYALRGFLRMLLLTPKKILERTRSKPSKVSTKYVEDLLFPDLPPDRIKLRRLFFLGSSRSSK